MPLGYNRVLGDQAKKPEARPHRVVIASWPTTSTTDPRVATFDALVGHLASSGYEGIETDPARIAARYFPGASPAVVAGRMRSMLEKAGLQNVGVTFHATDEAMRKLNWTDSYTDMMKVARDSGCEFTSYQLFLHPDYMNTGGLYREDERYLQWCADRVTELREATWAQGMNFYLEVHIDRMTEDPAACCRILDLCACELNGDMSHYLYRNFVKGKHVERVLKHVGHTHVRMARTHGDLSANVDDPKADWEKKGVTWQMFQFMMPALADGLSSRAIAGETGPMHLVKDTLTLDAKLVPLFRAMARYADASAQGITMSIKEPTDLKPWG